MPGATECLHGIGSVLAIGPRSHLRERVRRVRPCHDDREALARDFEHVADDLRRALVAGGWGVLRDLLPVLLPAARCTNKNGLGVFT